MREASLEAALDEEEVSTWRWEGEEEWTVSQAWPDGGDLSRGIIYHHSSRLSIHITVNTIKIPSRKGVSNEPYVFCARGPYSLPPLQTASVPLFPPNPAPLFPPTGLFPNSKPRKPLSNAQSANTDIADEESDMEIDIEASQLNAPDAFGKFLRRTPIPLVDDDSSDEEEPNFRSSSPTFPSSDGLPFPPPMITPFPTRRAHVLRVEHASRRMEKLVRKGLKELDDDKVWNEVTQDDEVPANQLEEELEEELAQVLEPDHVNVEGYGGEPVDEEGAEDEEDENYRPRTRTKVGSPDYEEEE